MNAELYQYYVIDRVHRGLRSDWEEDLAGEYAALGLSPEERMVRRFETACAKETSVIHPLEQIALRRTLRKLPDVLTEQEWADIRRDHYVHELGYVSNLSPDYEKTISEGLLARRESATSSQKRMIDAIIGLCDRYKEEAARMGRDDLVSVFTQIPRYPARNFREALQFFRILHFSLWLEGDYHNTVGRFDQYMYPYFKKDMEAGLYTKETALELVEDFFLSFNKDSDLYVGVQQGDNGQSMVLGGKLADGSEGFNLLSELCLLASRDLKLIDPKINLRVNKNTPLELYEKGTELTKVGLGFPQYSNDDVVIEGLQKLGYDYADAVNYVVAACWEFIIPSVGNDIANIGAVNFPKLVDEVLRAYLPTGGDFAGLLQAVKAAIQAECDRQTATIQNVWFLPSPFMDLLRDAKKYNNFGLHGCGIASAADALAAVKEYVFDKKSVTPERLFAALDTDWQNDPELLHLLRYEAPKMGKNDDRADSLGAFILDAFADALEGKKNDLGGVWRAGTGTAMFYLWHARDLKATADGRRKGEPFGTNFSPNLFTEIPGPLSDIESFTKQDLSRTFNG
ncbi:MAG: pyruvate formate-lyase, partial [Clostridia bacterium]|nr:pyruvate formate-lyase [Clostridia bacterium]